MNAVRTWSLAICFAVLAVAVLQYLAPPGSMEKMIRYVTGAFLVCAMAFSLKSVLPKIPLAFSIPTQYGAESEFSSFVESQEISVLQRQRSTKWAYPAKIFMQIWISRKMAA